MAAIWLQFSLGIGTMATLRKRDRKLKSGPASYWIVDYSVTERGRLRRQNESRIWERPTKWVPLGGIRPATV